MLYTSFSFPDKCRLKTVRMNNVNIILSTIVKFPQALDTRLTYSSTFKSNPTIKFLSARSKMTSLRETRGRNSFQTCPVTFR